jgi:DNA-binding CsgD family transcriptional regulator
MLRERRLLEVVEHIYEAAVDPAGLDQLASLLARTFQTDSALVIFDRMPQPGVALPDTVALPSATANFDAAARWAHAQHYHDLNIWLTEGLKNPLPAIVVCHELVDETTLMGHEWYDFCRQTGMFHCLGTAFEVGADLMGEIGIHRRRHDKPFTDDDKSTMAQLLPHLQRALSVQDRLGTLERERTLTLEIVAGLAIGVVIVDHRCRIVFSNPVAERFLGAADGLTSANGRLTPTDAGRAARLAQVVHEAAATSAGAGTGSGALLNIERRTGLPLSLLVSPMRSVQMGFGPRIPSAAVIFADPDHAVQSTPDDALAALYGLTRAEAVLLAAVSRGVTLAEYAERHGITIGTARTHWKHILQKSGFHRAVDLIRDVSTSPLLKLAHLPHLGDAGARGDFL